MSDPKTRQSTPCVHCQVFSAKTRRSHYLRDSKSVLFYLEQFREKRQEHLITLSLDSLSRLITRRVVTIGLLDIALAHPREVFADPLSDRAARVIIAHNHPSGEARPSKRDIKMTQQLVAAGQLLGLPLHDHIILGTQRYFSFRDSSLM
jgi:DNA repair protein RadC